MNNDLDTSSLGGFDNYSLRTATDVINYFPGAMRQNFILDPDLSIGKFDRGRKIGGDQWYNGPGTLVQALPDPSKQQNNFIFAVPRGNPHRDFGIDDRQTAEYLIEQLSINPLSQYTLNPNGKIPGFECDSEPDSYSSMMTQRKEDYKNYFENGNYLIDPESVKVVDWSEWGVGPNDIYKRENEKLNMSPNYEIVYNMSLDTSEKVNPMIAQGSSNIPVNEVDFSGKCYSGDYSGPVNLKTEGYKLSPRTVMDVVIDSSNDYVCNMDKTLYYTL